MSVYSQVGRFRRVTRSTGAEKEPRDHIRAESGEHEFLAALSPFELDVFESTRVSLRCELSGMVLPDLCESALESLARTPIKPLFFSLAARSCRPASFCRSAFRSQSAFRGRSALLGRSVRDVLVNARICREQTSA